MEGQSPTKGLSLTRGWAKVHSCTTFQVSRGVEGGENARKTRKKQNEREKNAPKNAQKTKKIAKIFAKNSTLFREKHARAKLGGGGVLLLSIWPI